MAKRQGSAGAGPRSYLVTLAHKTPLVMHADNIDWADEMQRWRDDPANKKRSKAGDDRSPAFRWLGALYHDSAQVGLPNDNLMRAFMEGGTLVPVPGGRGGKTFKAQTQSGMLVDGSHWPLLVRGEPLAVAPILALREESSFEAHQAATDRMGFTLLVKRARIGQTKHIRVRPMFEQWSARGIIHVWDDQITGEVLQEIVTQAGLYKGIGDWRPGGKTPGPFGMFTATVQPA